jgi:Spx/MgsR family transcriptional regulator
MTTTLFGIKNCDTIKKARHWLEQNHIEYHWHDYRVDGVDPNWLRGVLERLDWQRVLNKRGTTWRQLADEQKQDISENDAIKLMCEYPALIKRPMLAHQGHYHLGFKPDNYAELFNA